LGIRFLKHAERCRVLLHLIDGTQENIADSYHTIRTELESYSELLADKPEIIAISKCDALDEEALQKQKKSLKKITKSPIITLSSAAGINITETLRALRLTSIKAKAEEEPIKPVKDFSPI
jgi:GTP-binding protein